MSQKSKTKTPRIDVMVSSTVRDLEKYRNAARDAILQAGMHPLRMEEAGAQRGTDAVHFSRDLVRDADVYVGLFAYQYGCIPENEALNPDRLSVTEIEYRTWAKRHADDGMPGFLFLLDPDHPTPRSTIDTDNIDRIESLRTEIERRHVVAFFTSPDDLRGKVLQALESHRDVILERATAGAATSAARAPGAEAERTPPAPPAMYAVPDYLPGYDFLGRRAELGRLDRWAASDSSMMVVEAIGGMGKSALTWQWATTRSKEVMPDLAGTVWFSFYERGATMAACLRHVLAYFTGTPLKELRGRKAPDLAEAVLTALHTRPYLLVLDGLERVLVAYHRLDAAQIRDDQVESDQRDCTDPADREVLRRLSACAPSRILVSTRLFPRAFENTSHRPRPGVEHLELRGLSEEDATAFMERAGIVGDPSALTRFTEQFDHHPLILGILAGLINDYPRDPGSFDRWHADPEYGGALRLSELDLAEREHHIFQHALSGLDPEVRQVLCRAAAFTTAVDYETLAVINPFLPESSDDSHEENRAAHEFDRSLQELEQRGLLQFDRSQRAYDMHPVVRGYALDLLEGDERLGTFSALADHFRSRPRDRYETAKDLSDLETSLAVYRALLGADKYNEALRFFFGDFEEALFFSCEAFPTIIELLSPLFPKGLDEPPSMVFRWLCTGESFPSTTWSRLSVLPTEHEARETSEVFMAWADGPPYVNWWPLQRMKNLLAELEVEPPDLPPFDPDAVEPFPYEDEIIAFIEELEAEQRNQS